MEIGAVALLFCVFVFLTVMCTKTWRWFHVTMVFFVFIASLFLATIAAVSKITHTTWKREAAKKEIQLAELKRQFQAMSRGDRNQLPVADADEVRADDIPDNMFDVRSKLTRVMMDRGRVWRGASVQNVTKNADWKRVEIKLGTVENPNQIQGAGTVMYAFKEALAPDEVEPAPGGDDLEEEILDDPAAAPAVPVAPVKVPVVYMGEFRVVNVGPGDVTLSWTYAPTRMQLIHMDFASDKTSWVLYEKMPVDGHQLFSYQIVNDIELDDKDPGTPARNEEDIRPLFGKISPAELQQVFKLVAVETFSFNQGQIANLFGRFVNNYPNTGNQWNTERDAYLQSLLGSYPNRDNPAINSFLQSALRNYLRDGYRAEENEPEANVWVKVRFTKSLKLPADEVDGAQPEEGVDPAWKGLDLSFFDTQGRALVGRLRRGEAVEFDENQLAFFHKGDLSDDLEHLDRYKKLEADGTIERLFDIYVRPLNDYEFRFHNFFQKEVYLLQRIGRSQRELTLLTGANTKTQAEIAYRTQEKQKLVDDLAKHQRDVTVLEDYVAQLETQKTGLRQELGRVFQVNQQLANQLVEINRRLTEEIDRRTNAVGSSP